MDKLTEACTNADDWMMLVRHRGGDRAMSWRGFRAIFERTSFRPHCTRSPTNPVLVAGRVADCLKPRMFGWTTEFVRPEAGRTAFQLLEHCSHGTQDTFATASMARNLLRCFIGACMHGCRCIFGGGILCIDSWYALFGEVVRGCGC